MYNEILTNETQMLEPEVSSISPLLIDIEGYEGPLDVLLALARERKIDLTQISILQLADQYLSFVAEASRMHLDLAADYLVMAAWLTYLKSRLLLPELDDEDQPSGEEMANILAFQLQRLEAMRNVGQKLFERSQLGRDFFMRGQEESFEITFNSVVNVSLYDLTIAYGNMKRRQAPSTITIQPIELYSIEDAIERITKMLGSSSQWIDLRRLLPSSSKDPIIKRSEIASIFTATLELARAGTLKIRQEGTFGRIMLSRKG